MVPIRIVICLYLFNALASFLPILSIFILVSKPIAYCRSSILLPSITYLYDLFLFDQAGSLFALTKFTRISTHLGILIVQNNFQLLHFHFDQHPSVALSAIRVIRAGGRGAVG
ncbi:hypothetical protein PMIT1327_00048 [Prochlorococcus marinus str. MIT 1327]|nr:hypothetical protein PMIT1312_00045 [Prochlorococcus marinus str. MIT 1312]KZR84575.1 hypothetical protein PMIT1327_00048 [Prochlorococcus marinus str. MIT 1327]